MFSRRSARSGLSASFGRGETAKWLNKLVEFWWTFSYSSIEELIKEKVREYLRDNPPSALGNPELISFKLGHQAPRVTNVQTDPSTDFTSQETMDRLSCKIIVEADLNYSSDTECKFTGQVLYGSINLQMALNSFELKGTVRIMLLFFVDGDFPELSKATVCFKERPKMELNLTFLGHLWILDYIPLIKPLIHSHIMKSLEKCKPLNENFWKI